MQQGANKDDIISAGETALVCLYNGNPHHFINVLRYGDFCVKAAKSTIRPVNPCALPPSASTQYHSLRVYHQIQEWLGVEMSSVDWGWKISGGTLLPIMTDLQPAPKKFLDVIRCGCKSGCDTKRCSCRKHGLDCSAACSECRGMCANAHNDIGSDSDDYVWPGRSVWCLHIKDYYLLICHRIWYHIYYHTSYI